MAGVSITIGGNFAALNQLQSKAQETAARIRNAFMDRVGHRLLDGFIAGSREAATAFIEFSKQAVDAASDLAETMSKVEVVFGDQADAVKAWASNSASAFGQSKNEALSAAATYGNLFKAMGLTNDRSAQMSKSLVELAADFASFNNTEVPEAIEAIGAALRGESEPIRKYGVLLDDATLKAQAMADGIFDGKGSLEPATRALAAYSVILKQTTTAQGDFARTSEGLANSQRILAAQFKDAQAAAGEGLAPTIAKLTGAAKGIDGQAIGDSMADGFREAAGWLEKILSGAEDLANGPLAMMTMGWSSAVAKGWRSVADVALQSSGQRRNNAAVTEFNATTFSGTASSRDEINKKLEELKERRASLAKATTDAIEGQSPEVQDAMLSDLSATIYMLDIQAEKIRRITDEQLKANAAKQAGSVAEKAFADSLQKANEAYDKAREGFEKAAAESEKKRVESLSITDQLDQLAKAEQEIRSKFNVAIRTTMPGASSGEIAAALARSRAAEAQSTSLAESIELAGRLQEIEQRRGELLKDQAKTRDEAQEKWHTAVANYDSELALIRAQIDGDKERVDQLEREAKVRERIATLTAAGVEPTVAARRAEAIVDAERRLTKVQADREAEQKARSLVSGNPEDRIKDNEYYLDRLQELRSKMDQPWQSSISAVSNMQRVGGGGGVVVSSGLDYARRQAEYQREMVDLLREMVDRNNRTPPD